MQYVSANIIKMIRIAGAVEVITFAAAVVMLPCVSFAGKNL